MTDCIVREFGCSCDGHRCEAGINPTHIHLLQEQIFSQRARLFFLAIAIIVSVSTASYVVLKTIDMCWIADKSRV